MKFHAKRNRSYSCAVTLHVSLNRIKRTFEQHLFCRHRESRRHSYAERAFPQFRIISASYHSIEMPICFRKRTEILTAVVTFHTVNLSVNLFHTHSFVFWCLNNPYTYSHENGQKLAVFTKNFQVFYEFAPIFYLRCTRQRLRFSLFRSRLVGLHTPYKAILVAQAITV